MSSDTDRRTVFLLWHSRPLDDDDVETDDKLLGVYSSQERALARIETAKHKPGFRDYPDGFMVDECVIDRDSWAEGFH
jgi:hypothetical protein